MCRRAYLIAEHDGEADLVFCTLVHTPKEAKTGILEHVADVSKRDDLGGIRELRWRTKV